MNSRTRLIIIGLSIAASLWALWPTFRYYQLENDRAALIGDTTRLKQWDSLNKTDFKEIGAKRLKLGLDLRGGMYITMEVDAPALLLESAQRESVDETFNQVITATRAEAATSDEQVIEIFRRNFAKIAGSQGKSLLNYYDFGDLGSNVTEDAIIEKLARNINDAVDQAVEVITQRIDKYGVSEVTIQKVGGRRLNIELPGVTDESEIRSLLSTTARLEFKLVKNNGDAANLFRRIDDQLAGKVTTGDTTAKTDTTAKKDTTTVAKADSAKKDTSNNVAKADSGKSDSVPPVAKTDSNTGAKSDTGNPYAGMTEEQTRVAYRKDHPFTVLVSTRFQQDASSTAQPQMIDYTLPAGNYPAGEYHFSVLGSERDDVLALLNRPDVRSMMPDDIIIAFSAKPEIPVPNDDDNSYFAMYVLTRDPELTGEVVTDAKTDFDQFGKPSVTMTMSADGADKWAEITGRNLKKRVAIVLDSLVYSAPTVQSKITGGNSQITGSSDVKEANLLQVVLKAGALKAPIRIIEERLVGPSLGEDSIKKGIWSTLVATILVFLFMAIYYRFAGLVASAALLVNIVLTMAVLAAFGATLTLPGIGGLVLTIGMAVDGNILIYERIREELAAGRSLRTAIQQGYDKAWSAVLDTHITTLITGAILYFFGSGPIQGFAITLMIGLTATLFTSVFVTRTVFALMIDRGVQNIDFGQPKRPVAVDAARATKPA